MKLLKGLKIIDYICFLEGVIRPNGREQMAPQPGREPGDCVRLKAVVALLKAQEHMGFPRRGD